METSILDTTFPVDVKLHVTFKKDDATDQAVDFMFPASSKPVAYDEARNVIAEVR